jgi:hypothetical protein
LIELDYCNQVKQFGQAILILGNSADNTLSQFVFKFIIHSSRSATVMLGTGKGRPRRYYAPEEMREIGQACQKLQHIAIDMPPVELGTTGGLAVNTLSQNSDFEHVLVSNLIQRAFPSY